MRLPYLAGSERQKSRKCYKYHIDRSNKAIDNASDCGIIIQSVGICPADSVKSI